MVSRGLVGSRDEAFATVLHTRSPYYRPHHAPDATRVVQLVRRAGGVPVILAPIAPQALDALLEYFRVISGEHTDWDEYRRAMQKRGKSLIRITIEGWGPIATGGFPARLGDD